MQWIRKRNSSNTYSDKNVSSWGKLIELGDTAGGGKDMEVQVAYRYEGRLMEPQPAERENQKNDNEEKKIKKMIWKKPLKL